MDLAGWRDIGVMVIAFFYTIFSVVTLVIAFFIWKYSRLGFGALDKVVTERVRPALDTVEMQLLTVRDQTARLPGSRAIGLGEAPAPKSKGLAALWPFGKKKRRIPFLPS